MCRLNFNRLWSFITPFILWHTQPPPDMSRRGSVVDLTTQEHSETYELSPFNAEDDGLIHSSRGEPTTEDDGLIHAPRREPTTEDDGLIHAPRGEANSLSTEGPQDINDQSYMGYPLSRVHHISQEHISQENLSQERESQRNLQYRVQRPLLEPLPSLPHGVKRRHSEDHSNSSPPSPSSAMAPVDLTNPNIPPLSTEDASANQQSQSVDKPKGLLAAYRCPICLETPQDATSTVCGHLFCRDCILECIDRSDDRAERGDSNRQIRGSCPVCRKPITKNEVAGPRRSLVPLQFMVTSRKNLAVPPTEN
ncbi:hypothetical protein N7466_002211 [Penicillium verhagenii]|uniref:uncharacterized protein n=1 Tax=Penicillium verhagenii TaxID=1562060 RepID=UPI0025454640|nr:uncharacterized protein N7466_002211 [Penicillium verhagenii]KAJ5939077.1 hypothetical protein N7466_002211 [Penicillium verhagenii]